MRIHTLLLLALVVTVPAFAGPAPDWARVAGVDTIRIRTVDVKGASHETTIWLLVHEGQAYVRAGGGSRWDRPIDAHPDVAVEIEGVWYDVRATRIPAGPLYDAVKTGMRAKYGGQDRLIGLIRNIGGAPRILRLDPRPPR